MPNSTLAKPHCNLTETKATMSLQVTVTKVAFPGAIKLVNHGLNQLNNAL